VNKQALLGTAILILLSQVAHASTESRRATITGGGRYGRCTIEVNVDGAAEVEISGDLGLLRTLSGQTATWRRFQCNAPLPRNPSDFHFAGVDGRGNVRLLRDPRSNGGTALIHISDPKGGREGYTFDLQWSGFGGRGGQPSPPPYPSGRGPNSGGFPAVRAIQVCQDSVTSRLNQDGYAYVAFERSVPDDSPGRNDWVIGTVSGSRRFETTRFSFSCSVDFSSGKVRWVDVRSSR
jgi:hypothetical protein